METATARTRNSTRHLAARLTAEADWRVPLGEFLDQFYLCWPDRAAMADMLAPAPEAALRPFEEALLAATAEQLAVQWQLPLPPWAAAAGYGLTEAVSLGPAWLPPGRLPHAPPSFRARRLHTDPDPLRRARRPALPLPGSY
jgi:uncharacterized protein YbjT (DUF2867 family)